MMTAQEKYEKYPHLFFKNGKAKKTRCWCFNEGRKEMESLYGREIIQCGGLRCPFYPIECGKYNIEEYEKRKMS